MKFSCTHKHYLSRLWLFSIIFLMPGNQLQGSYMPDHSEDTYHISGEVTDISTGLPVQEALITILDADTREVISGDIYTDGNGVYDETIAIESTGRENQLSVLPSEYRITDIYPNPSSATYSNHLSIQYTTPGNRIELPVIEWYDILGCRVRTVSSIPEGVYFIRLRFRDGHLTRAEKMILESPGELGISLIQVYEGSGKEVRKAGSKNMYSDSANVLFVIEKNGYIHTERLKTLKKDINNICNFSLVAEGQKSSATIDSTGGYISVVNDREDTISLEIPPYAIWIPTAITLTALNTPPGNPIARNIFPGVCITPGGMRLRQPAVLGVRLATEVPDTTTAGLFCIRQDDFVLPIGNQAVIDNSITGEINHFSEFIGGEPSSGEAGPQAGEAGGKGATDPYGWEDTYDCVDALLWWAEFYSRNGMTEEEEKCFDDAKKIVEGDASAFLDMPIPDHPCEEYLTALFKFAELVMKVAGGDLETRIGERVIEIVNRCNLRGEIEYDHHVICTDVDRYTDTRIVGRVPFYVNTVAEPYNAIHGAGTANITITGMQEECSLSGSGFLRVNEITGELNADQQGILWLEMTLDETWYESTILYETCPDPDQNSSGPMPSVRGPTQVRFLLEDRYKVTFPSFDCDGSYNWILHIIHLP